MFTKKIKSIKKVGEMQTYDLKTPSHHNFFLSNGLLSHNSGKTYAALRLGEMLDGDFDIRNVCFTQNQFMDLLNGKTKKLKRGSCIVYDEIQISMNSLSYQQRQSKIFNYVISTFRHRNICLVTTSPQFGFINASLRKLFHARLETDGIDMKKKLCKLKPFLIELPQRKKADHYEKYLRVNHPVVGRYPSKFIKLRLPSRELRVAYEELKAVFTSELNKNISKELEEIEAKEKRVAEDKKTVTVKENAVLVRLYKKEPIKDIAEVEGISVRMVYKIIKSLREKDFDIPFIKQYKQLVEPDINHIGQIP